MAPRRRAARRPARRRRPTRRTRRARVPRGMPRLMMKPYTFTFTTRPNVLSSGQVPTSELTFSGTGLTNCTQLPLSGSTNVTTSSGSLSNLVQSSTNFLNTFDFGIATAFRLSDIYHFIQFSSSFDAYRINSVTCICEYLHNAFQAQDSSSIAGATMPTMYYYPDQDDAVVPTALDQVVSKQGVKMVQFGRKGQTIYKFKIKPRTSTLMAGSENTTAPTSNGTNINRAGQWLNCQTPDVPHFAMKWYMTDVQLPPSGGGASNQQCWRWTFKYNVSFRAPLNTS
nr:MAG: capsid protein [Chemarfal virus 215]